MVEFLHIDTIEDIRGLNNICGVYCVFNIDENSNVGYILIGSAKDIGNKRKSEYLTNFREKKFRYSELQDAYNENTEDVYFALVEKTSLKDKIVRENYYIDYFRDIGFNVLNKNKAFPVAERSDEVRKKLSDIQKGQGNGNSRYSREDIKNILRKIDEGVSRFDLAVEYDTSVGYINNIACGFKWRHVYEWYQKMKKDIACASNTNNIVTE